MQLGEWIKLWPPGCQWPRKYGRKMKENPFPWQLAVYLNYFDLISYLSPVYHFCHSQVCRLYFSNAYSTGQNNTHHEHPELSCSRTWKEVEKASMPSFSQLLHPSSSSPTEQTEVLNLSTTQTCWSLTFNRYYFATAWMKLKFPYHEGWNEGGF